jgi:hypothetical protein
MFSSTHSHQANMADVCTEISSYLVSLTRTDIDTVARVLVMTLGGDAERLFHPLNFLQKAVKRLSPQPPRRGRPTSEWVRLATPLIDSGKYVLPGPEWEYRKTREAWDALYKAVGIPPLARQGFRKAIKMHYSRKNKRKAKRLLAAGGKQWATHHFVDLVPFRETAHD